MINAQNGTQYEIWLSDHRGVRLAPLRQVAAFDYMRILNDKGRFNVTLPLASVTGGLLRKDFFMSFYRQPLGRQATLDFRGMLTHWEYYDTQSGDTFLKASGFGLNGLLDRRIVYAAPKSAAAAKTGPADNLMKAYVAQQMSSAVVAPQSNGIPASLFSVQANLGLAPSMSVDYSNVNLLTALKALASASQQSGTNLYFDIVPTGLTTFEFRTYPALLGRDRTAAPNKVVVSKEHSSLGNPRLSVDYDGEDNYIVSWGGGHHYKTALDTARMNLSPFATDQFFYSQTNLIVGTQVQSGANKELIKRRPKVRFAGDLQNSPAVSYGIHWSLGDKVWVTYAGYNFKSIVNSVTVAVDEKFRETVKASLEGTITL